MQSEINSYSHFYTYLVNGSEREPMKHTSSVFADFSQHFLCLNPLQHLPYALEHIRAWGGGLKSILQIKAMISYLQILVTWQVGSRYLFLLHRSVSLLQCSHCTLVNSSKVYKNVHPKGFQGSSEGLLSLMILNVRMTLCIMLHEG